MTTDAGNPPLVILPPSTYTVTFNSNGGSAVVAQTITEGGKVTPPEILSKSIGYGFGGWYKEAALINTWNFETDTVTDHVTLYAKWNLTLNIGNTGSGGGKIFYVADGQDGRPLGFTMTDNNEKCHYLEAAPADMSELLAWDSPVITARTSPDIGTGRNNTTLIIAYNRIGAPAAKACDEYTNNGKADWFLPSLDELHRLYQQRNTVGGFKQDEDTTNYTHYYWSSTPGDSYIAFYQSFINGSQMVASKDSKYSVRAIRAF